MAKSKNKNEEDERYKTKWLCKLCNKEFPPQGFKTHFQEKHGDIWEQYEQEYPDEDTWEKLKEDGVHIERLSEDKRKKETKYPPVGDQDQDQYQDQDKHEDPLQVNIIDEDLQEIEVNGQKYTPERLIWSWGLRGLYTLMEKKLSKLLEECKISNRDIILRHFRLYDTYKDPRNQQALQGLIKNLAPNTTPGVQQTITNEVFLIPYYFQNVIKEAMRHNPSMFDPNNYPFGSANPYPYPWGSEPSNPVPNPNPNPNPSFGPNLNHIDQNPMNPNQPFWIVDSHKQQPYGYTPPANNGGLTAADVKQLIREEFDRREREQREKERQEYIKELEEKVDRLEREKRDLERNSSSSKSSSSFTGSKLNPSGGDYDLTNPIDVLKFFNDFSDQMNKLGFAPNANSGGNNRPLNSNDVEMQRLNNELKMKQEDRKAMEKSAETIAKGLENVASNFGYGFGMAMGNTGTGGARAGAGAGARTRKGTRIWIDEKGQINTLCPRCGVHMRAPKDATKITCRNCNAVIYDKEAQQKREATAGAGAGGE